MSQIIIFAPDILIYRGTRQITRDMLPLDVQTELPPEKLASLGKLVTLDKDAINPLIAIRQRATRALEAAGTPFMKGYGVGLSGAAALSEKLSEMKREFMEHREKLLSSYTDRVNALVVEFPRWANHITALAGTVDEVADNTKFAVRKYRAEIVELPGDNDAYEDVKRLPLNLLKEAESALRAFLEENLGKEKVTQRGLKPLRDMTDKLAGLSFVDGSLVIRATEFDGLMRGAPTTGPILGTELDVFKSNIRLLLGEAPAGPDRKSVV